MKTVNLEAGSARAAYKRPSATLVGNCQLGSLTTGSPAGHLLLQATMLGVSPRPRPSSSPSGPCTKGTLLRLAEWWLNVQSGLQDPGNNTPGILQSA